MSIFALNTDDNRLREFDDEDAVMAACPVEDVMAQRWMFFAKDGEPLRPERSGAGYYLRPWASCSSCRLEQVLPFVQSIESTNGLTVEQVAQSLRH
ncbi:MAG: hypothetical protein QM803_16625 [Rhodocyclaceae bacterium]